MRCQKCKSDRIVNLYGKVSDLCVCSIGEKEHEGYVPDDLGVGGGDDIQFEYCADCGQIQGEFPLQPTDLEGRKKAEDNEDNFDDGE